MTNKFSDEDLEQVRTLLNKYNAIKDLNEFLQNKTGIMDFFQSTEDFKKFKQFLDNLYAFNTFNQDLGDFQTPSHLTDRICEYLVDTGFTPSAIVEPTCGEGNFVLSAIKLFPSLKYIYCVDIQSKYEWLFKLNILKLSFDQNMHVKIEFYRDSIFTHRISGRFTRFLNNQDQKLLILGNPPWVTSSELSILNSNNLPYKANIKKQGVSHLANWDNCSLIVTGKFF